MREILKSTTFQDFIAGGITVEKAYNVVEEYDLVQEYNADESKRSDPHLGDSAYTRCISRVIDLEPEALRAQYLASPGLLTISGHFRDLDVMIETACQYIREHYGVPSVVIDLGNGLSAVADTNLQTVKLKKISAHKGAIILTAPRKHILIQTRG